MSLRHPKYNLLLSKGYIDLSDIEEKFDDTVIAKIAIRGNIEAKGKSVVEYNFRLKYPILYRMVLAKFLTN